MKLGIIGCGNMAGAMLAGILEQGGCEPEDVRVTDVLPGAVKGFEERFGVKGLEDGRAVCAWCDVLLLAVKPQVYEGVIAQVRDVCRAGQLILSIAPGKTLAWLRERFQKPVHLVRAMPNTPAMVGEGMAALCFGEGVSPQQQELAQRLLESTGKAQVVPEGLMDAVVAVSGSSPAYVFVMVEAMADAAVSFGMARQQAFTFAAQAVLGSARMVLESGLHPAQLKDMVCSPGGTTIEAVKMLEKTGFRGSLMDAMKVCWEKSKRM